MPLFNLRWRPSETTKFIMPDIVLFIDTCLAFLMFGAGPRATPASEGRKKVFWWEESLPATSRCSWRRPCLH